MKHRLLIIAICFLLMAFLPLLSEKDPAALFVQGSAQASSDIQKTDTSVPKSTPTEQQNNTFTILDKSSGKLLTLSEREFCIGALAYEMPPSYAPEALKAQTIALYTHFSLLRERQQTNPDAALQGADFSADLSKGEYYYSNEQLKEKWGNQYENCMKIIAESVNAVFGEVIRDKNGKLIDACYFALSSGNTENAKDIFGFESPHLTAAASPWDCMAENYRTEASFTAEEFRSILQSLDKKADISLQGEKLLGKTEYTPSGTVLTAELGGIQLTGQKLRSAYGLRSACFTLQYSNGQYVFTVCGYGHGVGMSQYGANAMAKEGFDCHDILAHYYHLQPQG